MDSMLKIVPPREQLYEYDDMKKWNKKKIFKYQKAVRFWKTLWFMQMFRHYHRKCQVSESNNS